MLPEAKIKHISYYLPSKTLSNESLAAQFPEWSVEKIATKTGVSQRHIAAEDEFTSDMAVKAAQNMFQEYNVDPADIDYVLLCTQSADYYLPTTACLVQARLGIPTTAGALDFNLGCSGYVYGLSLAKGLIAAGIAQNVLLITSETYSKYINGNDKANRTIFGDAASASLICTGDSGLKIEGFSLGTDGRGADNLIVKRGGARYRLLSEDVDSFDDYGNASNENCLHMNGSEIFNFTIEAVPQLVEQTLSKNNLAMKDIDLFIFHQANKFMLNHLRKKISIPEEKFLYHIENCGNTVSSTIPIVLKEAQLSGTISPGMNLLLAGFGVGYSWGGVILQS